jgi:hypothetical protein
MSNRILLPRPGDEIHLSSQGYTTHQNDTQRKASLKRASKKYGALPVLRRLNLIRNITAPELPAHKIMGKDVKYMKSVYSHEKQLSRSTSKKTSKKQSKKTSKKQSKKKH